MAQTRNAREDLLAKEKTDEDSLNKGVSINFPNTIKYPKPSAQLNQSTNSNKDQKPPNKEETSAENDKLPKKRISGKILIGLITCVIVYEYYVYIFLIKQLSLVDVTKLSSKLYFIAIFHILLFMMLWCLIVTMKTIPGIIPLYWGFYIGDEEYKRKRYCLICNAFKPERSHHCSVCNICVLNMDHHCPWVNNCIGFYNRKFFMQLLLYLSLLLWFIFLTSIPEIYEIVMHCYTTQFKMADLYFIKYIMITPAYLLVCILTVLNSMFFKFHITLVLNNSTTIESLDTESKEHLKYKLSYIENWVQVFGFDRFYWFLPVFAEAGRPNGDGLNWKVSSVYEQ